ncbi:MAG: SsrA-binding protein SmpB, partial [Alphaproteobacteria bacterium]
MAQSDISAQRLAAQNRKARHSYEIEDTVEAGLVLTGSEVKALREGRANIAESYAKADKGEVWLINAHIPEYKQAGQFNHEPRRPRKLLLKKREIDKLLGAAEREGMTL